MWNKRICSRTESVFATQATANGRLDRIAPERRVEVVVQQDFELCCRFGSRVFGLSVHAVDPEGDEKREEDNRAHARTEAKLVEAVRRPGLVRQVQDHPARAAIGHASGPHEQLA